MGGTLPETSFNRFSIEASAYIKKHTFSRIDENDIPKEAMLCTCSILEQLHKLDKREGKNSESVGSWSVNYKTDNDNEKRLYSILTDYLSELTDKTRVPLLYRGK